MPREHQPSQSSSGTTRCAQENGSSAPPQRRHASQQPVLQGIFVFNGRVVIDYPGNKLPPGHETHIKIYDAVYKDYVYVAADQIQHYRDTMAAVRRRHPPGNGGAVNKGPEDPVEDDERRRELLKAVYYHMKESGQGGPHLSISGFMQAYDI